MDEGNVNDTEQQKYQNHDHQPITPTPDGFGVIQNSSSPNAQKPSLLSKVSSFFKPNNRKLALVLALTIITFGAGIYIYKGNYEGTAKKSNAARLTPTPSQTSLYDVVLYDDTSAGISALKALATTAQSKKLTLKVLWVKESTSKKAMAQNGLNIEDFYGPSTYQSGNVQLFRKAIESYYSYTDTTYATRTSPYIMADLVNEKDRLSYTNAAALSAYDKVISGLLDSTGRGVTLTKTYGYLKSFSYNNSTKTGTVSVASTPASTTSTSYTAIYFIDASVEADLARMMGASYKLGKSELVFNDKTTPVTLTALYDSTAKNYNVPEAFTVLLNLQKYSTPQLYGGTGFTPGQFTSKYTKIDGNAYTYNDLTAQFAAGGCNITHMINTPIGISKGSTATSGTNIFEFNQSWTDYKIAKAIFDWYMNPASRSTIRTEAQNVALHALRYLQENCSGGNLYNLPAGYTFPNVYVRGEMRIVGQSAMTYSTLDTANSQSVAIGYYNTYDRHLAEAQTQTYTPANPYSYVEVPYNSMVPQPNTNYPALGYLIVPTAISSDYQAYNSAVRMEMTRMSMGEAAGTAVVLAKVGKTTLSSSTMTSKVRTALAARNVRVNIP